MSKPVKELIRKELIEKFEGVKSLVIVGFTGLDGVSTHQLRGRLREKNIRMNVVKNSLACQAFDAVGLADAKGLLDGPSAVVFGADPEVMGVVEVIRELLDIRKESPSLTVKAALLDGEPFGPDRISELSKYPTREEAIARVVTCVLSPGRNLAGCLIGPGGTIAALLKAIQEKREDEGEVIAEPEAAVEAEGDAKAEPEAAVEAEGEAKAEPEGDDGGEQTT